MLNQRNSKKQGDVGVGIAIGWFVANGYTVSVPLTDSQDYDLVVEIEGVLQKVQVKTASRTEPSGYFRVELRTKGGNRSGAGKTKHFDDCKADWLFILTAAGERYIVPKVKAPKSTLILGPKWGSYRVKST